jgi:O-antigen ligase
MMMMTAALSALWMSSAGSTRRIVGVPIAWISVILVVTTVLTRALGAWILFAVGAAVLVATRMTRQRIVVLLLLVTPLVYIGARFSGSIPDNQLVAAVATISPERSESFGTRLENENRLLDKAMERPLLGWGGRGRSRVYDQHGKDISLTDGMWIILFGKYGLVGLVSWLIILLVPAALTLRRLGTRRLLLASTAPLLVTIVVIALQSVNWLFNGFSNPVIPMMTASLAVHRRRR